MLRNILTCLLLISAAPALAEDAALPVIEGADATLLEAAAAGDPFAQVNYVWPLLVRPTLDEGQAAAIALYLRRAHDTWSTDPAETRNAAWAANQLTALNQRVFKLHDALGWALRCLEILEPLTDDEAGKARANCLENAGIVATEMSRYEDAIRFFDAARLELLYLSEPFEGRDAALANLLMNEGVALDGLKRHREAIALYEQALERFSATEGPDGTGAAYSILNIGASYWYMKDLQPAWDWTLRGLPMVDRLEGAHSRTGAITRINLALIAYDMGKAEEAMNWNIAVLPYIAANPRQSLSEQRWTFELFRRLFADRGEVERAILFGKMAVNAQQEIRKLNRDFAEGDTEDLRAEWRRLYQGLADLLIAEGRFSEAQAVLNMEKEQEAFEFLKRDRAATLRDTTAVLTDAERGEAEKLADLAARPVAAYEVWRALDARLAAGEGTAEDEDRLFLLEDAMAEAQKDFLDGVAAFLADVDETRREGFRQGFDATGAYQAILRARNRPSAILQLAVLDEVTHLFLTLPGATVHREVAISRAEIRRRVFDTLQAIEAVSPEAETHLAGLYDLLIAPVRADLDLAQTQVIMTNADDVLRYVPFAALHDGAGYLVEDFAFAHYVAAVPTAFGRPARSPDSAAGFGVTRGHAGFDPLPGVAAEIEALFTASDGQGVLTGTALLDQAFDARALRRSLRNPPELLHIASHFALRPGQVDDSFLLLGDGSQLKLSDLSTTRFNFAGVDLLTLSACQTARGGDGSEIDGVGAAALKNGASAVMASLWPVADAATPILMHDFYSGLLEDGLDKAEALRRAQIAMLGGQGAGGGVARAAARLEEDGPGDAAEPLPFSHPYFWSAFVLMGNWL